MVHSQGDDAGALLLCDRTEKKAFLRDLFFAEKLVENGYYRVSVHFVNDSSLLSSYTLNGKDMVFGVEITSFNRVALNFHQIPGYSINCHCAQNLRHQVRMGLVVALPVGFFHRFDVFADE